jgi:fucose 4-O-acetylase-like acetyltransferase
MPAFVVITGYLSRSYRGSPRQIKALVSGVLVPYLVFQVIVRVEPWLLFGEPLHLNIFTPAWSNWFLLALFAWRLMVPVLQWLRFPVLCSLIVVLLSVFAGGISQGLSGARILSYLPFFALGLAMTPARLEVFKRWARTAPARLIAGTYVLVVGILMYVLRDWVDSDWFMMSVLSAIDGDLSSTQHVLMRLVVLAFTTSMLVAILVLVPQRQLFFTHMGAATLTMYLLQEATLLIPRHYIAQWDGWSAPMAALLVIVGAGYALVLGTQPVQRITKWLVDPVGTFGWLRRLAFKESESVSKN